MSIEDSQDVGATDSFVHRHTLRSEFARECVKYSLSGYMSECVSRILNAVVMHSLGVLRISVIVCALIE